MRAKKIPYFAIVIIGVYLLIGLLAPLLATSYPYHIEIEDTNYYPAFRYFLDYYQLYSWDYRFELFFQSAIEHSSEGGLVPFQPNFIDLGNVGASPPGSRSSLNQIHWLGTDNQGKDLLSGLIHGINYSLKVSFISVSLGLFIAIIFGVPVSFYGNDGIRFSILYFCIFLFLSLCFGLIYFVIEPFYWLVELSFLYKFLLFLLTIIGIGFLLKNKNRSAKNGINLKLDDLMMKIVEFNNSIPKLLVLLVIVAMYQEVSTYQMCIIIALLIWPNFYRYIRARIIELRSGVFQVSLENLGIPDWRILIIHYLPLSLRVVVIPFIFSIISVILFEATLSFLGLRFDGQEISWGNLLSNARSNLSAWWLTIFPGIAIFLLVYALNVIGDYLLEKTRT